MNYKVKIIEEFQDGSVREKEFPKRFTDINSAVVQAEELYTKKKMLVTDDPMWGEPRKTSLIVSSINGEQVHVDCEFYDSTTGRLTKR